jgi:hypothetical protein
MLRSFVKDTKSNVVCEEIKKDKGAKKSTVAKEIMLEDYKDVYSQGSYSLNIELRTTNYTCKTANIKISILRSLRFKCLLTCLAKSILLTG